MSDLSSRCVQHGPARLARATIVLLLLVCVGACRSAPGVMSAELGRLQGHWQGRGPGGECTVSIAGNSLVYRQGADFWFETTFTLPAETAPAQLHATIVAESAPEEPSVGTVVVAIYELDGGALELGVIEDFDSPPSSPLVADWERAIDRYSLERISGPG